jgi:hypothetical protein
MQVAKRIGWVAIAGAVAAMPGALFHQFRTESPVWYAALASLFSAVGIGLFGIVVGAIILIAARDRPDGGLKPAVIASGFVGVLCSYVVISAALKA